MLVMRGIPSRIRSGLMEKTATDQTTTRPSKTKRITIQLPPLTGIYKVPGSGSLFARKPEKNIRQAIALANKMARGLWAMMVKKENYTKPVLAAQ